MKVEKFKVLLYFNRNILIVIRLLAECYTDFKRAWVTIWRPFFFPRFAVQRYQITRL
jgi:hypothetical protein